MSGVTENRAPASPCAPRDCKHGRDGVLPAAPTGSPMTYMASGRQYIVLAYGGGSSTGLLGLALP